MDYILKHLTYKGGHPSLTSEKDCFIIANNSSITIKIGSASATIPINQISGCRMETQDQLERRITATRLLAIGVFALAFKKKKINTEKYLTIDFSDNNGISNTVLFSGKGVPKAHSAIYQIMTQSIEKRKYTINNEYQDNTPSFKDIYSMREDDDVPSFEDIFSQIDTEEEHHKSNDIQKDKTTPYEEIKCLKELLDMGAITQEEFETKKKELLGL